MLGMLDLDASGALQQIYDDFYMQLGQDTLAYVRTVCQTLLLTVPKAIVHCQVSRALNRRTSHLCFLCEIPCQ